ncbi:hypothetical protein [Mesorhizobium salmacidum]|uniref:Secreted protein n=1 Tax=Mesorhizobium salmacidum TaxID=3015171 RepID=A0ABU8KQX1_9HYPH
MAGVLSPSCGVLSFVLLIENWLTLAKLRHTGASRFESLPRATSGECFLNFKRRVGRDDQNKRPWSDQLRI